MTARLGGEKPRAAENLPFDFAAMLSAAEPGMNKWVTYYSQELPYVMEHEFHGD